MITKEPTWLDKLLGIKDQYNESPNNYVSHCTRCGSSLIKTVGEKIPRYSSKTGEIEYYDNEITINCPKCNTCITSTYFMTRT